MSEENKAIARRYLDEMWNKKDESIRDEIAAFGERYTGGGALRAGFPDLEMVIEDQIAEGEKVLTRFTIRGTHTAEYESTPPTNQQATWTGMFLYRNQGGKIVERWANWDKAGLLEQIGALPSSEVLSPGGR
jgi:predicted ester cyclase